MKKIFTLTSVSLLTTFAVLATASAQTPACTGSACDVAQGIGTFAGLINGFTATVVKAVGSLFMAGAMVAFFYGIVEYVWGAREGKPEKIANGNLFIKWSLVALFCMFSVYGIIRFGQGVLFNGKDVNTILIPDINFIRGGGGTVNNPGTGPASRDSTTNNPGTGLFNNSGTVNTGGMRGGSSAQDTARQAYQICIANGNSAAQCDAAYSAYGGSGSGTQDTARQAYQICIANGNSAAQCDAAYNAYGGSGSGTQDTASQAYQICIANGNSASQCDAAYSAYGGSGSGTQNLAQQAYDVCISNGNTDSQCRAAYEAYGGTQQNTSPSDVNQSANGCSGSNVGDSCETSSGGTGTCQADDFGYSCQ